MAVVDWLSIAVLVCELVGAVALVSAFETFSPARYRSYLYVYFIMASIIVVTGIMLVIIGGQ